MYRKLYQAESCSEYFKQIIRNGLTEAISLFQQRLSDCKQASITLQSNQKDQKRKQTKKHHEPDECHYCSEYLLWLEFPTTFSDCDVGDFDSDGCCDRGGCDLS